jgi:hypothetical protein
MWDIVVSLGDEARQLGYALSDSRANAPQEWMTFLEGYARAARWDEAREISRAGYAKDARFNRLLCAIWLRSVPASQNVLHDMRRQLACPAVPPAAP